MTLEQTDKQYVLQTYARDYTNFVKGVSSTLYDDNGKDYIDFASGIGVNSVGHGNDKLVEAISNSGATSYLELVSTRYEDCVAAVEMARRWPRTKFKESVARSAGTLNQPNWRNHITTPT